MSKDLNKLFDDLLPRYIKAIEKDYKQRYKKARDKNFVLAEIRLEQRNIIGAFETTTPLKKLIDAFTKRHKRGEDVNDIITDIKENYGKVDDVLPFKRIGENGEKITLYLSDEEKEMKRLALDERKLLKLLIRYTAFKDIQNHLPELFSRIAGKSKAAEFEAYDLKWTGTNKNEFVQLVYGLFKAGLLNKGEGEITRTVESLAKALNVDLSDNWQSNHSSSIHRAKSNYKPGIFSKIQQAYLRYAEDQVENKRKNR